MLGWAKWLNLRVARAASSAPRRSLALSLTAHSTAHGLEDTVAAPLETQASTGPLSTTTPPPPPCPDYLLPASPPWPHPPRGRVTNLSTRGVTVSSAGRRQGVERTSHPSQVGVCLGMLFYGLISHHQRDACAGGTPGLVVQGAQQCGQRSRHIPDMLDPQTVHLQLGHLRRAAHVGAHILIKCARHHPVVAEWQQSSLNPS